MFTSFRTPSLPRLIVLCDALAPLIPIGGLIFLDLIIDTVLVWVGDERRQIELRK